MLWRQFLSFANLVDRFAPSGADNEELQVKFCGYNIILVDAEDDPYAGGFQVI